ncbi:hypothetical protein TKK_0001551 [Trichogramma kaykai]|uniref:Uncharacterized protein n=1 Tax=Trichogramma kaykai TaxID=54128 RepID=A0ABD2X2L3_9HYME
MAALKYVVLFCLISMTLAQSRRSSRCRRERNDELLDTIPFLSIVVAGQPRLDKEYHGYKITCIRCTSLLDGLGEVLGLDVLNGGYSCNFVLAQVKVTNLLGSCRVYGRKLRSCEKQSCKRN